MLYEYYVLCIPCNVCISDVECSLRLPLVRKVSRVVYVKSSLQIVVIVVVKTLVINGKLYVKGYQIQVGITLTSYHQKQP